MKKTFYITIEGGDGSGKTTLVQSLYSYLIAQNHTVLLTKEFGTPHDPLSQDLRPLALSDQYSTDEIAAQLIFAAMIRQHQQKVIKPTIESNSVEFIISDRGIDSNYAYAPAQGLSNSTVKKIFSVAYENSFLPDLTFYLNISPELSMKRIHSRPKETLSKGGIDRVEKKGLEVQQKARKNFLELKQANPERIQVIDVTEEKSPEDIFKEALEILTKKLS